MGISGNTRRRMEKQITIKGGEKMKNFYKMTFDEINAEIERYQLQLMRQQADKIPLTEAQLRRWKALSKAHKKINMEYAK